MHLSLKLTNLIANNCIKLLVLTSEQDLCEMALVKKAARNGTVCYHHDSKEICLLLCHLLRHSPTLYMLVNGFVEGVENGELAGVWIGLSRGNRRTGNGIGCTWFAWHSGSYMSWPIARWVPKTRATAVGRARRITPKKTKGRSQAVQAPHQANLTDYGCDLNVYNDWPIV